MSNIYILIGAIIVIGLGALALTNNMIPTNPTNTASSTAQNGSPVTETPTTSSTNPSPNPNPNPNPNPTPSPSTACASQVAAAQASAQGQICAQVATQMGCPGSSQYFYTARNACESSYLAEKGWLIIDPPPSNPY